MKLVRGTGAAVVALLVVAAFAGSASGRGVVVEDWLGASGLGWQQGSATDFLDWSSSSSDASFSFAQADSAGRGSLVAQAQFLPHQGPGTGEWRFRAPGTSTVTKAEYGPAYFTKEGCLNEGMRLADGSWQATRNARAGDREAPSVHPTACGANGTVTGAKVTTKDGSSAVTITGAPDSQTFCSTAGCGLEGSPTGNQAVFGAERIKQGRPGFAVVLPGARLTLTDYDAPKLVSGENTHPRWVRSAKGEVTIDATDTGLGVKSATVTHAALSGDATSSQTHPCSGDRTDRCPATWSTARSEWTTAWPYDTDEMPEGVQPYGVAVRDIVDNRTPDSGYDSSLVPPSKIDRSDPTGITGTGQIPDLDNTWFLGNDTRTITATAHDTYSGVKSFQIETIDGTVLDAATLSCPDDQCPRDVSKTLSVDTTALPEGITPVRVRATDLVENTANSRSWRLQIDRSNPHSVEAAGEIPNADDRWTLGNDVRSIVATAHDRYSGVKRLELRTTDGQILDSTTFDCPDGQCPVEVQRTLSVNTNGLPEGVTRVELRAIDALDHSATSRSWSIKVDRSDPSVPAGSGALRDVPDGYTDGRGGFGVVVDAADSLSGVARVAVVIDGTESANVALPCEPHGCAAEAQGTPQPDLATLGEGSHSVAVRAYDQVGYQSTSDGWPVTIDRTAPGAPEVSDEVDFDPDTGQALADFDEPEDPLLPDGSEGAGIDSCEASVNGGAWQSVDGDVTFPAISGVSVTISVRCRDRVGNIGSAGTKTITPIAPDQLDASWRDFDEGDRENYSLKIGVYGDYSDPEEVDSSGFLGKIPVTVRGSDGRRHTRLSSSDGFAYFSLPAGEYDYWLSQVSDDDASEPRTIEIPASGSAAATRHVQLSAGFSAMSRSITAAAQSEFGWFERFRVGAYCIQKIKGLACSDLRGALARTQAIEEVLWGVDRNGLRDSTRMNSFQHSFGTAYFMRIIQVDYGDDRPWGVAFQSPEDAFDVIMENEKGPMGDSRLVVRQASFQDRNNNRVGYGYQRTHRSRNAVQLCSAMRAKAFHARQLKFPSGSDRAPNPPPDKQTRLVYRLKYGAAEMPKPASQFPNSHPCYEAFRRTD